MNLLITHISYGASPVFCKIVSSLHKVTQHKAYWARWGELLEEDELTQLALDAYKKWMDTGVWREENVPFLDLIYNIEYTKLPKESRSAWLAFSEGQVLKIEDIAETFGDNLSGMSEFHEVVEAYRSQMFGFRKPLGSYMGGNANALEVCTGINCYGHRPQLQLNFLHSQTLEN